MKMRFFALACVAMIAEARRSRGGRSSGSGSNTVGNEFTKGFETQDTKRFTEYALKFGRQYKDANEFQMRQRIWKKTDDLINETNKAADESDHPNPMRAAHNKFSDMTDKEREAHLGVKLPEDREGRKSADRPIFNRPLDIAE